ncbi:hypothetical protein PPYR_01322 [Photinus pyralis]|uniref:RRP15-like protein n=1 Tax=Photinus pyralis TaxID=7054 RepID=A0A1Y1KJ07_PHOPY|nr:RRP15-like protein [Photinus pyralis]KAB0804352.1 hypothetical protein PPYR_01322 [Photinus pyralis]
MAMKTKRLLIETDDTKIDSDDEVGSEGEISNEEEAEVSDDGEDDQTNSGWADSIAKILKTNKPQGKKTVVLSKARKITDLKKKKAKSDAGFEIETEDGRIRTGTIEESSDEDEPKAKKRKDLPSYRVKPNILDKDRERTLSKIATKGVVQLFNAVKKQQKDIDSKLKDAGSLEVKKDKVLKNINKKEFLNVLMGGQQNVKKGKVKQAKAKAEPEDAPSWNVLRDDFLMSAKMKDWDKKLEDELDIKEDDDD